MADFFSNLLLRSSKPTSGLILQPRLPSLFESVHDTNTILLPEADSRREITPSNSFADHIAATPPMPRMDNTTAEMSQTVKQPTQKKISLASSNGQSDHSFPATTKAIHSLTDELPNDTSATNTQTLDQHGETESKNIPTPIIPENDGLSAPLSTLVKVEPRQVANLPQEERTGFKVLPTGVSELQENEFIHQQKVAIQSPTQQNGYFIEDPHQAQAESSLESHPPAVLKPKTEVSPQITLKAESTENIFHSHPEPVLSGPALKPVLPVQSMPVPSKMSSSKPEQIQENEMVVQVHIGRIEVRAINAPIPQPAPITNISPQPKMSLDDYLQKRE